MDIEAQYQSWKAFFKALDYEKEIQSIADNTDVEGELVIDFHDIFIHQEELATLLVEGRCEETLKVGETAIESFLQPDQRAFISLRIENLYQQYHTTLEDLRTTDLGKLRYSRVQVSHRKPPQTYDKVSVWQCSSCGFTQEVQQDIFKQVEPLECPKEDGGCGKRAGSTTFLYQDVDSLSWDKQVIYVHDPFEKSKKSKPDRFPVILDGPCHVGKLEIGDRIGLYYWVSKVQSNKGKNSYDFYLRPVHIERVNPELDYEPSSEDIQRFKSWREDILEMGIESVAPHIYGYQAIKLSLFLQFIGTPADRPFHVLLFGDGSTAKSQLMFDMMDIWPEAHFSGAKTSTTAGLTASVVQDEVIGERLLEAGLLVLADKNLACIDELDKGREEDRDALHMVMEQCVIPVNKWGINTEIPTTPTILAACNPKKNFKVTNMPVHEQANLQQTLLQRFFIWMIKREYNKESERNRILHSMRKHERRITVEDLRKYRKYVQRFEPVILEPEINYVIERYLEEMEASHVLDKDEEITPRIMEDIKRISMAVARAQQKERVERFDIDVAFRLFSASRTPIINGENDSVSIETSERKPDPVYPSPSDVTDHIIKLDQGNGVKIENLVRVMKKKGFYGVSDVLDNLYGNGAIRYVRSDKVSLA